MRLLRAILILFAIPAILYLVNVLQDYADAHMTLNPLEEIIMGLWPFIVIGLFVIGLFMATRSRNNKGGGE